MCFSVFFFSVFNFNFLVKVLIHLNGYLESLKI